MWPTVSIPVHGTGFGTETFQSGSKFERFDMAADPYETHDVAAEHPEVADLQRRYDAWFDDVGSTRCRQLRPAAHSPGHAKRKHGRAHPSRSSGPCGRPIRTKPFACAHDARNGVHELLAPGVFAIEWSDPLTRAERQGRISASDGWPSWLTRRPVSLRCLCCREPTRFRPARVSASTIADTSLWPSEKAGSLSRQRPGSSVCFRSNTR